MTHQAARRFVKQHGIVLEGGRGPVPNLAEMVAGESIRGSWWGHRKGHEIFSLTRAIRDWRDVLVCRAVGGKITYVHRRLWPALIRLAPKLEPGRLAALHEVHTPSGRHELRAIAYPRWVPPDARKAARHLTEADASRMLGDWAAYTFSLRVATRQHKMCVQPANAPPRSSRTARARLRSSKRTR